MREFQLHPLHLVAIVAAAIGLGLIFLQVSDPRTLDIAPAAASPAAAQLEPAGGQLVADAAPAPAPAPAPASAPAQPASTGPDGGGGDSAPPTSTVPETPRSRGGVSCTQAHRVVRVASDTPIHRSPGGGRIGSIPARSAYLGSPMFAWVQAVSDDGRWGRVSLPWTKPVKQSGWIRIDSLDVSATTTMAVADLSERSVTIYRRCRPILEVRSAIGRSGSPSPTGRFWVTDRVQVPSAQRGSFGSFAFGLSTVQPNLPQGWTGGDQMAIHGTGAPGSIGQAASAGCLRVTEDALRRLKPLLRLGTPVVIQA